MPHKHVCAVEFHLWCTVGSEIIQSEGNLAAKPKHNPICITYLPFIHPL